MKISSTIVDGQSIERRLTLRHVRSVATYIARTPSGTIMTLIRKKRRRARAKRRLASRFRISSCKPIAVQLALGCPVSGCDSQLAWRTSYGIPLVDEASIEHRSSTMRDGDSAVVGEQPCAVQGLLLRLDERPSAMQHDQPVLADKLLDCSPDRVSADTVLVG